MTDRQGVAGGVQVLREEADRVRLVREQVARLRAVLEEAFIALAATLPVLSQELEDLASALGAGEVEESTAMLAAALEALRGVQRLLAEQRGRVILASRDAKELLSVLGRSVEELGTPITVALNFAEGLSASVFDAAASAVAAKSVAPPQGEPGSSEPCPPSGEASWLSFRAFSAQSRRTVPALHETVGILRRLTRQLLEARTELGTRADELARLTDHVGHALDTAAADLAALRNTIQRAHKCIVRSSQLTSTVMTVIQRQDIIRQKLENVLLALMDLEAVHREMEMRPEDGASVALAMQKQIATLSGRLIDDVQHDLDALLAEVSKSLGSLVETSEALAALRGFAPDLPRMRAHVTRPIGTLSDAERTVESLGETAAEGAEVGRILPKVGEDLSAKLSALVEATRALSKPQPAPQSSAPTSGTSSAPSGSTSSAPRSVSTAPRSASSAPRSANSSELLSLRLVLRVRREFETLIDLATHRFSSMKHRGLALTETAQRVRMDAEGARRLESAKERTTALRNAALDLIDRFERALSVGAALGDEAQRFLKALESVRRASTQGGLAVAECGTLMQRADTALSRLALQVQAASVQTEVQGRLQRLVERFTVLSHKAIARDATAAGPGRGDAPGTLTIF